MNLDRAGPRPRARGAGAAAVPAARRRRRGRPHPRRPGDGDVPRRPHRRGRRRVRPGRAAVRPTPGSCCAWSPRGRRAATASSSWPVPRTGWPTRPRRCGSPATWTRPRARPTRSGTGRRRCPGWAAPTRPRPTPARRSDRPGHRPPGLDGHRAPGAGHRATGTGAARRRRPPRSPRRPRPQATAHPVRVLGGGPLGALAAIAGGTVPVWTRRRARPDASDRRWGTTRPGSRRRSWPPRATIRPPRRSPPRRWHSRGRRVRP